MQQLEFNTGKQYVFSAVIWFLQQYLTSDAQLLQQHAMAHGCVQNGASGSEKHLHFVLQE